MILKILVHGWIERNGEISKYRSIGSQKNRAEGCPLKIFLAEIKLLQKSMIVQKCQMGAKLTILAEAVILPLSQLNTK